MRRCKSGWPKDCGSCSRTTPPRRPPVSPATHRRVPPHVPAMRSDHVNGEPDRCLRTRQGVDPSANSTVTRPPDAGSRSLDLTAVMAGVEFHESDEVFDGNRAEHRSVHWRPTRGDGTTRRLEALVRRHEARASVRGRGRARRRIHRLRRPAFREHAAPEDSPEHDAQQRVEQSRYCWKGRWLSGGHVHRRLIRSGDVLDDLARRPLAWRARRVPCSAGRDGVRHELIAAFLLAVSADSISPTGSSPVGSTDSQWPSITSARRASSRTPIRRRPISIIPAAFSSFSANVTVSR